MLKTSGTHKHKWMIANEGTVLCNKQIILIVLAWWDIAYCELPEAGDGGREVLDFLQCTFFLTPECGSCTYHRQKGVAEAESWLGGEVLVRDEADPDLTAFGSVASRYRLWAAPATQDGFLSQIFYFHIVVPGRRRKKILIISLSETITRYWSTPLSWNCLCPRYTATLSNYWLFTSTQTCWLPRKHLVELSCLMPILITIIQDIVNATSALKSAFL